MKSRPLQHVFLLSLVFLSQIAFGQSETHDMAPSNVEGIYGAQPMAYPNVWGQYGERPEPGRPGREQSLEQLRGKHNRLPECLWLLGP